MELKWVRCIDKGKSTLVRFKRKTIKEPQLNRQLLAVLLKRNLDEGSHSTLENAKSIKFGCAPLTLCFINEGSHHFCNKACWYTNCIVLFNYLVLKAAE